MSAVVRPPMFAPFRVRSFRFQWPADLCTSWAFEMETIILGWYVLVETQSVLMLTIYASLNHLGTLLSPMFGVAGDRIGQRNLLSSMRAAYTCLAGTIMTLSLTGLITPVLVLMIASVMGLIRPSDIGMRTALIGATMPPGELIGAMGIQRTTQDSARIAGALTGAGLMAMIGMGLAYVVVTAFYLTSFVLTLQVESRRARPRGDGARASPLRELREGLVYVWRSPLLRAVMIYAFLLNATAFPLFNSLLPYVAKEMYGTDQTILGHMVAGGSLGALAGSLALSRWGAGTHPARVMILAGCAWFAMLLVFAQTTDPLFGIPVLFFAGLSQGIGLVVMAALLLQHSERSMHGRVMGIRMLCIYGNVPGLLLSAPLLANFGYPFTATVYCLFGIAVTALITFVARRQLWRAAPAARSAA